MKNTLVNGFTSSLAKEQYELVLITGGNSAKKVKVSSVGINSDIKDKKQETIKKHKSHYLRR